MSKVFVGGLSWDTTDDSLKKAFEPFGTLVSANIITDRETGRSRGFGFVQYEDEENAQKAVKEMTDTDLDGKVIRCDIATDRGGRGGDRGGRRDDRRERGGFRGDRGGYERRDRGDREGGYERRDRGDREGGYERRDRDSYRRNDDRGYERRGGDDRSHGRESYRSSRDEPAE